MTRFFLILACFLLVSCQSADTTEANTATPEAAPAIAKAPINPFDTLPIFPRETAEILFNQCDYIDLSFFTIDPTINFSKPNEIKGMLANLLTTKRPPAPTCRTAFGYISFNGQGQTLAEAEIYFEQNCTYLVFRDGNKYAAICQLGDKGIGFFNQVLQMYQKATQANDGQ